MLTVVYLLDTRDIDDIVIMTFVSKGDTLVTATFVTNEKGQYHYMDAQRKHCWMIQRNLYLMAITNNLYYFHINNTIPRFSVGVIQPLYLP